MTEQSNDPFTPDKPLVTVVLPTNGRVDYLREAIDSIRKQSFTDYRVLVGDNGASDECAKLVGQTGDQRFSYIRHPVNLGAQGNWLELVRLSQTELIATLHDDDVWQPDFLQRLLPPMFADSTLSMCFGDFNLIDCNGATLSDAAHELSHQTHRDVMPAGPMHPNLEDGLRLVAVWNAPNPAICAVIRRQAILDTEFPPQTAPLYDLWLDYQLVKRGARFHFVPGKHSNYRIHAASATSAGFAAPEDYIFDTILADNADAGPVLDEIRAYWAHIRWGRATRKMTAYENRIDSQRELLAAAPLQPNPVKRMVAVLAGHSSTAWNLFRLMRSLKPKRKL